MKIRIAIIAFFAVVSAFGQPAIVNAVRASIAQKDLPGAERIARGSQARTGPRPELAAALSWLARAHLAAGNLDRADAFANESREMAGKFLTRQKLDDDPWLPTAVGAAIEVHAQVLAARGERPEALTYLREQLKRLDASNESAY